MTPVILALLTLLENVFVAEEPAIQALIISALQNLVGKFQAVHAAEVIPNLVDPESPDDSLESSTKLP